MIRRPSGLLIFVPAMMLLRAELCTAAEQPVAPSAAGVTFIEGSTSTVKIERDGRTYLVDVAARSVREAEAPPSAVDGSAVFARNCVICHGADGKGKASLGTPNFTDPKEQAKLTDTQIVATIRNGKKGTNMPAWKGKLADSEIEAVAKYVRTLGAPTGATPPKSEATPPVYQAGDDMLLTLPTGRRLDRHGLYLNFTHRFALDPAFSGAARGGALLGLDGFSLSSLGLRYGVTQKLSVSVFRSPTFIARPIQFMAAYNFLSESDKQPLNVAGRVSIEGQDDFRRNYTENFELIISRSLGRRAQVYFVPTFSLNARRLFQPPSYRSSAIPDLPGHNTFSTGVGLSIDIRPTTAIVMEVTPTLVNGRPLGIHRPAYSIGIQKKIWRHAFTFGFTQSPGVTVSQRAGTRAAYLNDPGADKPGGMFIAFDLTRQLF